MLRLAVVIVSYNTCELLRACLASVAEAAAHGAHRLTVETLVVDNASRDGSATMVATEFPEVRLNALDENVGFTRANNLALALLGFNPQPHAATDPTPADLSQSVDRPDYVLLLNPDTAVQPNALLQLVDFMEATPAAGACGPTLRYGDGAFQHGAFHFPGLAQIGLDLFPLHGVPGGHRFHGSRLNGRYAATQWARGAPFTVDFILGAALFMRGAAIAQIGGLDEGYFMYCEEMDWCFRLHAAGWKIYAVPAAVVTHFEGQSSRQVRWPSFVQLWRSRLRFYGKYADRYPLWYLWSVRGLLRTAMHLRLRNVRHRFACGRLTGTAAAAEIEAYQTVREL